LRRPFAEITVRGDEDEVPIASRHDGLHAGDEPDRLDLGLRDEHPVEGIGVELRQVLLERNMRVKQ